MKQRKGKLKEAGETGGPRRTTVGDLMSTPVLTVGPERKVQQVRALLAKKGFHSAPVVDRQGAPIGIVTATDFLRPVPDDAPVSSIMTERVYTVPAYEGVHVAARIMRNHHIHHVVVTHEGRVVGIVSSFDLLRLVEDRRFVSKQRAADTAKGGKRKRSEES